MDAGCSDYLTKPVRRATLIHTISTHLHLDQSISTQTNETDPTPKKRITPLSSIPTVALDPKIKKLVPKFLKNKRGDAQKLLQTLEAGDMEALCKQSHTIKGTSWMYGFKELGDLCFNLEQAARDSDLTHAIQLSTQISQYLNTVQISYKKP